MIAKNSTQTDASAPSISFKNNFVQIINGNSSPTEVTRHGINPANLSPKEEVPVATQADLNGAVDVAKKAFEVWSNVPYDDRRRAILAYADALDELRTEFRDLLISEQGKPVSPWRRRESQQFDQCEQVCSDVGIALS